MGQEYMEEKIADIIEGLCRKIRGGIPLREGYKMFDQEAEKELVELAEMFSYPTGYLPKRVFDKLLGTLKGCLDLQFWWIDTRDKIKEAIDNLEKMKEERSLEDYKISQIDF